MSGSNSYKQEIKDLKETDVKILNILADIKEKINTKETTNPLKDSMIRDLRATKKYTEKELEGVLG